MKFFIWVVATLPVVVIVVSLLQMAARFLRGEEMESGGSWGKQFFDRNDRARRR